MKALALTLLALAVFSAAANDTIFPEDDWTSGFIPVNDKGDDLFYIHFKSRRNASTDPLTFWLTGGPGCASEIALFFENGPYTINDDLSVKSNAYSWNAHSNIIFIDQPIGTGYSHANAIDYVVNEDQVAADFLVFLKGFHERHPEYKGRDLYITGESYAGHYIPAIGAALHKANDSDIVLKGVAIGNGWVDPYYQYPAYNEFAYENNLISSVWYYTLKAGFLACQGLINTGLWPVALEACQLEVTTILGIPTMPRFNVYDIREKCQVPPLCYDFSKADNFLKQDKVQKALNTTGRDFQDCNMVVHTFMLGDWLVDLSDKVSYLVNSKVKVLVYSGDKDFICNWRGGEAWTNQVKWDKQSEFQSTNYTVYQDAEGNKIGEYKKVDNFIFMRVYDAGHMVPMDQPKNAQTMIHDHFDEKSILNA
mmetsp:Transcript_30637/g.35434  ORF Transcript_30637/g.35434 Transcript_30637/m.35434 type:complete len:423 (-) Transcript_30637:214-1482(-)